jgi:hypothetical protein
LGTTVVVDTGVLTTTFESVFEATVVEELEEVD